MRDRATVSHRVHRDTEAAWRPLHRENKHGVSMFSIPAWHDSDKRTCGAHRGNRESAKFLIFLQDISSLFVSVKSEAPPCLCELCVKPSSRPSFRIPHSAFSICTPWRALCLCELCVDRNPPARTRNSAFRILHSAFERLSVHSPYRFPQPKDALPHRFPWPACRQTGLRRCFPRPPASFSIPHLNAAAFTASH